MSEITIFHLHKEFLTLLFLQVTTQFSSLLSPIKLKQSFDIFFLKDLKLFIKTKSSCSVPEHFTPSSVTLLWTQWAHVFSVYLENRCDHPLSSEQWPECLRNYRQECACVSEAQQVLYMERLLITYQSSIVKERIEW